MIGFHASHEQFPPGQLLRAAIAAEACGWDALMCSDHLLGWSGEHLAASASGLTWLAAVMEATTLPAGIVCALGQRHHPATIAQAMATLASMYPGRPWVAAASGEFLNEHVTGDPWPDRSTRRRRLAECAEVMRRLWHGEEVTHTSDVLRVDRARVSCNGAPPPSLRAACMSPESAKCAAPWAEGMITVNGPLEEVGAIIDAYRAAGGAGPVALQVHVALAGTDQEAQELARNQWRFAALEADQLSDLAMPEEFDLATCHVTAADLRELVVASSSLDAHLEALMALVDLGADEIYIHQLGPDQVRFVGEYGSGVLPALREHMRRRRPDAPAWHTEPAPNRDNAR